MMSKGRPFIKALLIDLSGTLHIGSSPTPDAVRAVQRLREAEFPFRFCSNTSNESQSSLCKRLNVMGFQTKSEGEKVEVWTSLGAVRTFLHEEELKRPFFLLSDSAKEECSDASPVSCNSAASFDSVVVGHAPSAFTYDNLNTAFRILVGEQAGGRLSSSKPSIPLIATHKARYLASSDGVLSLGPGPFVAALENAAGLTAEVVGKPTRRFFETVIGNFHPDELVSKGLQDGRIAVIGDDVEADLGEGAIELGLWRVLVKTGKYRPGDEVRAGVRPPDELFDSFAAFVEELLAQNAFSELNT